jgi:hypothetical protein
LAGYQKSTGATGELPGAQLFWDRQEVVPMTDAAALIEQAPIQDQDLLLRLNQYFDVLDQRLRHGQGWFIFNAAGGRLNRIAGFIQAKLSGDYATVDSYLMLWRDFALSAYVNEVGLAEIGPGRNGEFPTEQQKHEFELARHVTEDTCARLMYSDMVVLIGMQPSNWHEALFLDRTIDERYQRKLATILLTSDMPHTLQSEFDGVDPSGKLWSRVFERMYETSLVAL